MKNLIILVICILPVYSYAQNVGVGTTTPDSKLHILTLNDSNALRIEKSNPLVLGSSSGIYFKTGDWFTGAIKQIGTSTVRSRTGIFGYASTNPSGLQEHISISDDGNVGIGNTNPTQKLEVNGSALVTNTVNANDLVSQTTIISGGNITAGGGLFAGTTNSSINGGIRYNTPDNKMEYRENNSWKRISKPFYQSNTVSITSDVRNALVVHPSFEWTVPETGYYQVNLTTDMYPVFKTNGCTLQYLDNEGAVWVYSKTRSIQFFSGGSYKWYIVNGQTGCQGAQSIPLHPAINRIIYLNKDEIMSLAFEFDMFTVPAGTLDKWTGQAQVNFVKID